MTNIIQDIRILLKQSEISDSETESIKERINEFYRNTNSIYRFILLKNYYNKHFNLPNRKFLEYVLSKFKEMEELREIIEEYIEKDKK